MEGCSSEGVFECTSPLTLFLVGRTGNGKSETGNSILGTKGFESRRSSSGVTSVSELRKAVLADGRILNVIDTPGLFDSSVDSEIIAKEFGSCIDMGIDGIHAVIVVFSVCCRFSEEEKAVKSSLLALFGREVYNYMIIVFTGGDELENDGKTLDDFLCDSPEALKELLSLCEDRFVLFDNRTKDPTKRADQVQQLLSLVDMVLEKNGGQPFRNEIFSEVKKSTLELQQQTEELQALNVTKELTDQEVSLLRDERFKQITETLLSKVEHLLEEERALRVKAQEVAKAEHKKSEKEIEKLRQVLERLEFTEVQEKQREQQELKQGKKEERKPKTKKKQKMKKLSELLERLEHTEVQEQQREQQELKTRMEKLSEVLNGLEFIEVQEKQIEQQEPKPGKEERKPKMKKLSELLERVEPTEVQNKQIKELEPKQRKEEERKQSDTHTTQPANQKSSRTRKPNQDPSFLY